MAQRIWLRWPTIVAITLFFLNVDYVIMPLLALHGVRGLALMICAMFAATGEVLYWHWYAGWFGRTVKNSPPARAVVQQFHFTGKLREVEEWWQRTKAISAELWQWFEDHLRSQAATDSGRKQELLARMLSIIKRTHVWAAYPIMLLLGFLPYGWAVGIVIARVHPAPWLMVPLLMSNAVKTYFIGLLYVAMPRWLKFIIIGAISGALVWGASQGLCGKRAAAVEPKPATLP